MLKYENRANSPRANPHTKSPYNSIYFLPNLELITPEQSGKIVKIIPDIIVNIRAELELPVIVLNIDPEYATTYFFKKCFIQ
jgi:hypothetical protein